jgi:hypothetical protein
VELRLSLYGHLIAGNRWEGTAEAGVVSGKFEKAPQWRAIFRHPSGAAMGVYVDDFELLATEEAYVFEQRSLYPSVNGTFETGTLVRPWT